MHSTDNLFRHRRFQNRLFAACAAALVTGVSASNAFGTEFSTTWIGGDGSWSIPTNWSGGVVPNADNPISASYQVYIDGGAPSSSNALLDINATVNGLNVSAGDSLNISDSKTLTFAGAGSTAVVNAGNINIQSSANTTGLAIPNTLSFTGGGTVLLGATKSQITGAGMLINSDNMIHGEGTLSSGSLAISNAGTIQADVAGKTLTINPSGAGALTSTGTLSATNGGILVLSGLDGGSFALVGSSIHADDASQVELINGASLTGGTFSSAGSGAVSIVFQTAILNGFANTGTLLLGALGTAQVSGAIDNSGRILLATSTNREADFTTVGSITLSGNGTITMQNTGLTHAFLDSINTGSFTNVDNTIQGNGEIGANQLLFHNQSTGVIDANMQGTSLILDPSNSNPKTFINDGTLRASNGGILILAGNPAEPNQGSYLNNGSITAQNGSEVQLYGSASLTGGTLAALGTGTLHLFQSQNAYLSNMQVSGRLVGDLSTILTLTNVTGTAMIDSSGSLSLLSGSTVSLTRFRVGSLSVSGNGSINLGTINLIAGGGTIGTSRVTSSTLGNMGGVVDLADHDLIVDYNVGSPLAQVRGLLKSGYASGTWKGIGVQSSSAAASVAGAHPTALGYGEVSAITSLSFPAFGGLAVDRTTVVIGYTYSGDANLDGIVDSSDFVRLAANFNGTAKDWSDGDFNYDGKVNALDFNMIAMNFGQAVSAPSLGATVPEPAIAAALVMVGLLRRKRAKLTRRALKHLP